MFLEHQISRIISEESCDIEDCVITLSNYLEKINKSHLSHCNNVSQDLFFF